MTGHRIRPPGAGTGRQVKRPRQHASRHLDWIRQLPSVISGVYGVEACHVRYGDPSYGKRPTGMGEKPDDKWCVPMTPDEHREQHAGSEREFWDKAGIDPLKVALALWAHSGDTETAIKIIGHIGDRSGSTWKRQS